MDNSTLYPTQTVPPANDPTLSYWLYGARVWAEYQITGRRLWEFRGYDGRRDIFFFQDRQHLSVMKFFTPAMLMAAPNFRPFCLDIKMMNDSSPIHTAPLITLKPLKPKGLTPNVSA